MYYLRPHFESNGCNHRPSAKAYHKPEHTLVLYGANVGELNSRLHWPESLREVDGEVVASSDIEAAALSAEKLEKQFRRPRVRQWRDHHPNGSPVPNCSDLSSESSDESESGTSSDCEDGPVGFGIAPDCLSKCVLYHEMGMF